MRSECEREALDLYHFTEDQLLEKIDGILSDKDTDAPKILVFLEKSIAYVTADTIGANRSQYPTNIRIIRNPSTAYLKLKHILYAFAKGVDGVILGEGPEEGPIGKVGSLIEERAKKFETKLEDMGINPFRLWVTRIYLPQSDKLVSLFKTFTEIIEMEGRMEEEKRAYLKNKLNLKFER